MMRLDEAIQYCLEVAEKQEKLAENNMNIQIKKYKVYDADEYIKCKECAEEHKQLAEWLKELKNIYGFIEKYHSTDAIYIGDIKDILKGEI